MNLWGFAPISGRSSRVYKVAVHEDRARRPAAPQFWLTAAIASAIATAIDPYEHGVWLVAYLFLVGFAAQFLLARGRDAISPTVPAGLVNLQTVLWNLGVVAVPVGVLADVRIPIAVGSLALVAALSLFWSSVRAAYDAGGAGRTATGWAFAALLAFMLASTVIGMALGSDIPWTS